MFLSEPSVISLIASFIRNPLFPECIYLRNDDVEFILDDEVFFPFFPRPKRVEGDQQRR